VYVLDFYPINSVKAQAFNGRIGNGRQLCPGIDKGGQLNLWAVANDS
jgi:hypothetical protein